MNKCFNIVNVKPIFLLVHCNSIDYKKNSLSQLKVIKIRVNDFFSSNDDTFNDYGNNYNPFQKWLIAA